MDLTFNVWGLSKFCLKLQPLFQKYNQFKFWSFQTIVTAPSNWNWIVFVKNLLNNIIYILFLFFVAKLPSIQIIDHSDQKSQHQVVGTEYSCRQSCLLTVLLVIAKTSEARQQSIKAFSVAFCSRTFIFCCWLKWLNFWKLELNSIVKASVASFGYLKQIWLIFILNSLTLAMKTPLHWYFSNTSINFAKSRQGKSNHCNYSRQYCKNTTLLVWNSCNLILAWLNYRNMIETFQERWKGFQYFSSMKYPLKIKHFWSRLHGCSVWLKNWLFGK